jgi:hypothetical protein
MSDLDVFAGTALALYSHTKERMVESHHGPYDLAPTVDCEWSDGTRRYCVVSDRDLIRSAVRKLRGAKRYQPRRVAFCADAWTRPGQPGAPLPARGDLGRAVREGDLSIDQVLCVTAIDTKTGETAVGLVDYGYDDHGAVTFGELRPFDGELTGAVADQLRRLVTP